MMSAKSVKYVSISSYELIEDALSEAVKGSQMTLDFTTKRQMITYYSY